MKKIVVSRGDNGISGELIDLSEEESAALLSNEGDEFRLSKIKELAAYRYSIETGGFDFYGTRIATDDRSKTLLMGARIEAAESIQSGVPYSVNWKVNGGFVVLDAPTVIAISNAMRGFVQACFDCEKNHADAIQELQTTLDIQEYDFTTGWTE